MDEESRIGNVSVRAILVFALLVLFAASLFTGIKSDVLDAITTAAIGWYFGQRNAQTIGK